MTDRISWDQYIRLVTAIWHHLYVVGDWNRLIQIILDILNAEGVPDPHKEPRLLKLKRSGQYNLARALHDLGELDKAGLILVSLIREASLMQWERAVGYCSLRLAQVLRDQGHQAESRKHYVTALQVSEKWGELLLQEMVLIDLAVLAWRGADDEAALDHADKARDLAVRLDLQLDQVRMNELVRAIAGVTALDEREEIRAGNGQAYLLAETSGARGLI